jgi:hypothetical protein
VHGKGSGPATIATHSEFALKIATIVVAIR